MVCIKIREYLKEHGITQTHVANKINMPIKSFSEMINGKRKCTAEEARDIAIALNLNPGFFLQKNSEDTGNS